jgi:hypothetical protein
MEGWGKGKQGGKDVWVACTLEDVGVGTLNSVWGLGGGWGGGGEAEEKFKWEPSGAAWPLIKYLCFKVRVPI